MAVNPSRSPLPSRPLGTPQPCQESHPIALSALGFSLLGFSPVAARNWGWGSLWALGFTIGAIAPVQAQPIATPSGNEYQITGVTQSGSNLSHSFEQFGLNAGDIANFLGSPDLSNILGRVTGGNASVINGLLQVSNSNANLYLMNPAGLIFGPGASLDLTGSFTGTTATAIGFEQGWFNAIGSNDYPTLIGSPNQFQFAAATATGDAGLPGGSIVNMGSLSVAPGQNLSLLGRAVFNSGSLSAPGDQIAVVAVPGPGSGTEPETQVLRYTEPGMILGLELLTLPSDRAPMALATLEPSQLPAYLTGGNLSNASALIVEADGTIRLSGATVPAEAGAVMVSGTVEVGSETGTGGDVVMTGSVLGLLGATVDASGATGGGNIRIGGDYQGGGSLPTAEAVYVDAASDLGADAVTIGDGGEIIVWADHSTRFYGTASAQGGLEGGNGGLVETSGKVFLDIAGAAVTTSAPQGETGIWLLDPMDLRITAGTDDDVTGSPNFTTTGTDGLSILSKATLEAALASNSVIITTTGGSGGNGDITLETTIDSTSGNDLTLTARRFILTSGAINLSGTSGKLTFNLNQVNPETNAPTSSIQAAHDAIGSVSGTSTIILGPGTFSGATLNISKNITLQGSGSDQTFLDGQNSRRVVSISSGSSAIVDSITIQKGDVGEGSGAGIRVSGYATLNLNNSVVTGNVVNLGTGAGISSGYGSTLTLNNTRVENNQGYDANGGGIYAYGASVSLINSTVTNNVTVGVEGGRGGGISIVEGNLTLVNTTVSNNVASNNGGGIENYQGTISITDSTIAGNQSSNDNGGGLYTTQGVVTIQKSTVSGNLAGGQGGGIMNYGGTVLLTNSTVSGNLALDGGGIQNTANLSYAPIIIGTIGLTNTTVANNIATSGNGGGVNSGPGTALTLTNSLLANNLSGSLEAGDVIGNGGGFGFNLTLNGTNLVENGNITGTSLITGIDPQLSALGNYGGPTQTHLILPGSVAIDAGDNNSVMETTDQRGGSRITGTAVDLGAVEFQGADLSVTAGSGQSTVVNTNFATPITVSATETTFGNPLRGSVVTLSAPTTGPSATFASPSLTLDASGQGSTIATANTIAGLLTATATVGSNSASLTLTNLADAPSNLLILGGNNQSTIVNTAFSSPLSVQVTDQYGNPISGTLVAFNAPGSGASGQNTSLSITTDSRGTANTPYRANTVAGRYPVTSTVANTSLSTAFSLTNLADAPSILVVDNGNNQVATVESPFPNALTVRVTDQYGNPVAGVPVNFTVQLGATGATGFLNSTTGISDASGLVSTTLTANSEQGSFQVIATATGLDSSATFDLENTVFLETVCPPTCDDSIPNDNDESSDLSEPESEAPLLSTPNDVVTEVLDNATFAEIETTQIEEFSDYLDIPDPGPLTVEEAQNILRERDEETGTTTAYITSRFSPVTVPDPTTSRKLAPPSGSPTALSLANAGSLAVSPDLAITTPPDRGNKELDPLTPWIGQLPGGSSANPDDRLEVVVITATGEPEIKRIPVTRQQIIFLSQQMQQDLDKPIWVYKRRMQALYERIFAPLEADLQALGVDNLLLSLGDDLRGIPWGALYDGEQFLVEKYSVGVTPSLSLTDTEFVSLHDRSVLAMGAAEFTNQNPLPAVPIELDTITTQFGTAASFLNQDFTEENLRRERDQLLPGVIHLATHANFLTGDLNQSYIQIWGDEKISLGDIDSFQWFTDSPVELLVLSACRTALGDRQAELGFGGLAVKAGVKSALASLWYVSDAGTLALMTEFYRNLRDPEVITKGQALQKAQIALIHGDVQIESNQLRGGSGQSPYTVPLPSESQDITTESLAHPYYWAAFTLIGSPW